LHRLFLRQRAALAGWVLVIAAAAACGDSPTEPATTQGACAPDGSLSVAIYGGIRRDLSWGATDLECSGMPRPNGAGARLHFAGTVDTDGEARKLSFIIGLPDLKRAASAQEIPAIVTLIEEDSGRFFSTAEAPVCWSDVLEQRLLAGSEYGVRGVVYCVSPLAELNGTGGVTFTDLEFSGRIDWGEQ